MIVKTLIKVNKFLSEEFGEFAFMIKVITSVFLLILLFILFIPVLVFLM